MKVCLFFDGKNFHMDMRDHEPVKGLDYSKFAQWLIQRVAGPDGLFWGAYYYTGIDPHESETSWRRTQLRLIARTNGFFVRSPTRQLAGKVCPHCGKDIPFTREKQVDTQLTCDMLGLAATATFDIAVLLSGDGDFVPAVEAVQALGKNVYVATWSKEGHGLSSALVEAAFGCIDLSGADKQVWRELTPAALQVVREEIARAEMFFVQKRGYLGVNHFVTRWKCKSSPNVGELDPDMKRMGVEMLKAQGEIEIYATPDGSQAIRAKSSLGTTASS